MSTTLNDLTTEFYNIVGTKADDGTGTNVVYPLTFVQNLANIVQREICRSWKFPFLKTKSIFALTDTTTITSAIATTDVTISVSSTTGFTSTGSIWIEGDIVTYTGLTSTSFTGCTGIDIAHTSGAIVEQLYVAPTNFSHRPTLQGGESTSLESFTFVTEDEYDVSPINNRWTMVYNSSGTELLRINTGSVSTNGIAVFNYYKIPSTMTSVVDATIPDTFAISVIPRGMAGIADIVRADNVENLGTTIMQIAKADLIEMKRHYGWRLESEKPQMKREYTSYSPNRSLGLNVNPAKFR